MSEPRQPSTPFGAFLLETMRRAGFQTPTELARAAQMQPSVLTRWVYGSTRPQVPQLKQVAGLLNLAEADLIAAAYPAGDAAPPPLPPVARLLHPLAAELDRYLAEDSPLIPAERAELSLMVDRTLTHYRVVAAKRRGERKRNP